MPKITVLRNLGQGLPDYTEGQTVNVSNEEADQLCQLGLATLAGSASTGKADGKSRSGKFRGNKQVQGVPDQPAIAQKNESKIKADPGDSVLI